MASVLAQLNDWHRRQCLIDEHDRTALLSAALPGYSRAVPGALHEAF